MNNFFCPGLSTTRSISAPFLVQRTTFGGNFFGKNKTFLESFFEILQNFLLTFVFFAFYRSSPMAQIISLTEPTKNPHIFSCQFPSILLLAVALFLCYRFFYGVFREVYNESSKKTGCVRRSGSLCVWCGYG
jgi:NhaP-type Na+/H+ or K+/H+ antiporter